MEQAEQIRKIIVDKLNNLNHEPVIEFTPEEIGYMCARYLEIHSGKKVIEAEIYKNSNLPDTRFRFKLDPKSTIFH